MPDNLFREIADAIARGEPVLLATIVRSGGSTPRRAGARILIRQDGTFTGTVGGGAVERLVREKASAVLASGQPELAHFNLTGEGESSISICGGIVDVFLEPIIPAETLYIMGAGHISQAIAAISRSLGFRTVLVDPRQEFNCRERFPTADELIVEDYTTAIPKLPIDEKSYVVICTPGHIFDEECLRLTAVSAAKYVGMIGSKKKVKEVKEHLVARGVPADRLERVHAPIGLEISAETPEEIAVSILAEIVKIRREG